MQSSSQVHWLGGRQSQVEQPLRTKGTRSEGQGVQSPKLGQGVQVPPLAPIPTHHSIGPQSESLQHSAHRPQSSRMRRCPSSQK